MDFVESNPVKPVAGKTSVRYFNYFQGYDPSLWLINSPSYQKLIYKDLYENIDLVYTLRDGKLKYDFYVYPGGNYRDIQLQWNGPVSLQQSEQGVQVTVSTTPGERSVLSQKTVWIPSMLPLTSLITVPLPSIVAGRLTHTGFYQYNVKR